jgi:hypothetical protein
VQFSFQARLFRFKQTESGALQGMPTSGRGFSYSRGRFISKPIGTQFSQVMT